MYLFIYSLYVDICMGDMGANLTFLAAMVPSVATMTLKAKRLRTVVMGLYKY